MNHGFFIASLVFIIFSKAYAWPLPQLDFFRNLNLGPLRGNWNNGPTPPLQSESRQGPPVVDFLGNLNGMVHGVADKITKITQSADVNNDMRGFQNREFGGADAWNHQARRFCRRYPGHPKCRRGLPQVGDISSIMKDIIYNSGKWLPKVPIIPIRDPLVGIGSDLRKALQGISTKFGQIKEQFVNNIKNVCRSFNCKQQSENSRKLKENLLSRFVDFEKKVFGNDAADKINMRFDRTLQLKQALLEKAQLKGVVAPIDNGVYDQDTLLTEQQANFLLNDLGKGGEGAVPEPGSNIAKRASVFFEDNPIQKWPTNEPISYTLDSSLDNLDRNDVQAAISEIEQKTCIRFRYMQTAPKQNHINYQKISSSTFCGLSYIGRVEPANPVYLSFQCQNGRGIALHETMHALGVNHQHLRMDRDQHIKVDWSNINPQQYDSFVVSDSKLYTTYGVKYAFDSIMHYNAYTGAVNIAKPTMIPLINEQSNIALLGQRSKMSDADVELLNKMYCKPGCEDKNVYCGAWALSNFCTNPNNNIWMRNNCKKSCDLC